MTGMPAATHAGRPPPLRTGPSGRRTDWSRSARPRTPAAGAGCSARSREDIWTARWASTFPGVAISVTVLGANLMGDRLRDALDPHLRY